MKKFKEEKGITLVALIITIVVLLILAVVAIGAVQDSGIIAHAQNAGDSYTIGQEKEQIGLAVGEWQLEKVIPGNNPIFKNVIENGLQKQDVIVDGENEGPLTVTFNKTGNVYTVTKDGEIEGPLEGMEGEDNVPPVETDMPVAIVGKKAKDKSTINGEKYSSLNPVIPAGFAPINVTIGGQESSWTAENGPEVYKGLVITDNVDENGNSIGNEFVWIPVTDFSLFAELQSEGSTDYRGVLYDWDTNTTITPTATSRREPDIVTKIYNPPTNKYKDGADKNSTYLEKAGVIDLVQNEGEAEGTINEYDFKKQLQNEFNSMANSVLEYGGFFVGRYKMSLNGNIAQSISGNPFATADTSSADTWYGLYSVSKTYSTSGVVSEMMWGCQYDAMMRFIGDKATKTGNEVLSNIYNLNENLREWTKEASENSNRVYRGGYENVLQPPCYRGSNSPVNAATVYGSRLVLYVE